MKKIFWIISGCISAGLGTLGAVIPLLPTCPFLMLAAFCFARSSQKLHDWFIGTKLYKENLEDFISRRGMTKQAKIRILMTVTLLMIFGIVMMGMKGIVSGCVILGIVWFFHIIYFIFGIKTIPAAEVSII